MNFDPLFMFNTGYKTQDRVCIKRQWREIWPFEADAKSSWSLQEWRSRKRGVTMVLCHILDCELDGRLLRR